MSKEEKELRTCYHWTEWERKAKELEEENNKLLDVISNYEVKVSDLEQKLEQTEKDLADYQFNYPTIKELSKENAELKGRTEGFEKQILGLLYKYESVYKRFPDLKDAMDEAERVLKENTELKSELTKKADTNHSLVEQMADLESKNAELKEKAKELLKEAQGYIENEDDELYDKIEQFIKEIKENE